MENRSKNGNGDLKSSLILFKTAAGQELRATLVQLNRFNVVFEICSPVSVLRASEVLTDFRIVFYDRTIYSGQSVVRNIIDTGPVLVCESTLQEKGWKNIACDPGSLTPEFVRGAYHDFMAGLQQSYVVLPEFKLVVADMQSLLAELRLWLEEWELNVRSMPGGDRARAERDLVDGLVEPVGSSLNHLFEKFEIVSQKVPRELEAAHSLYVRRQLHQYLMASPFMHRIYEKPLGYAGDYEMVNMIWRDPHEGSSLFSKVLNCWFLSQLPAEAHRNRIKILVEKLVEGAQRARQAGRRLRILNLACGPAHEVQTFLAESPLGDYTEFTMLDFNAETLAHTQSILENIKKRNHLATPLKFEKKSVHNLLKEASRSVVRSPEQCYDFVYCAGLFDYLTDSVCRRLTNILYEMVAPGGTYLATNVDAMNPIQRIMDFIFEWHLIYRTNAQFAQISPEGALPENTRLSADPTGCNIFVEVKKN